MPRSGLRRLGKLSTRDCTTGLARVGARRPRLWLAAGEAAFSILSWWPGRIGDRRTSDTVDEYEEAVETLVDLPDEIRALAACVLSMTDAYGAPELRAQLAQAQLIRFDDEDAPFWPGAQVNVPETLPRAVPGNATFPIRSRFRALGIRTFDVRLIVEDGRLASVTVEEGANWTPEAWESWNDSDRTIGELGSWPVPHDVELLVETRDGPAPVR